MPCSGYGNAVYKRDGGSLAWDDWKAESNEVKHAVTFGLALRVFDDDQHVDVDVSRPQDGENRRKAVGRLGEKLCCVVYTMRGEVCWIISARRTNSNEDRLYGRIRL